MGSRARVMLARANPAIRLGPNPFIGPDTLLEATDGGTIVVGRNFAIGTHGRLIARRGGKIIVGDDVLLGDGVIVVALDSINVGQGSKIAEYVVIRDQDHGITASPLRDAGFETAPISIGEHVWIGAKATVLRGSSIGDHAVIGAHALVKGEIGALTVAVGVPAKTIRNI